MYKAHFDASFDRHKGIASLAYIIYNSDGKQIDEEVIVTQVDDSNVAEWIALITLLKRLKQLGIREVEVFGDNKNVIEIAKGLKRSGSNLAKWRITQHHYKRFKHISFQWIKREKNKEADKLTRSEKKELCNVVDFNKRKKNKINTYTITPRQFDFNFSYKECKRKIVAR